MADEELQVMTLRTDFYRDSFKKVMYLILIVGIIIVFLVGMSLYLYFSKPAPVVFKTYQGWRVQGDVPLDQPYLPTPDLLQWVATALPQAFVYDFNHYSQQLRAAAPSFTDNGWKIFLNHLNVYANYNTVQTNRLFVNGSAAGAPFILQQGLFAGKWAWWVQMPVVVSYAGYVPAPSKTLTLQVLIVRVSTLTNLNGVGIDNVIVSTATTSPVLRI